VPVSFKRMLPIGSDGRMPKSGEIHDTSDGRIRLSAP
jgi:hypothetical protein